MNNSELKIEVSGGRVIEAKVMPDGCCVLTVELATTTVEDTSCHQQKDIFKRVPASELRLDDEFLTHQPKTKREQNFKNLVEIAIKNGLKDFWRPVYDPSFEGDGHICYRAGMIPAVGKSYNWWVRNAKDFWPERRSRLGTKTEYIAFLAVLIKELVNSGKSVEWAWNAVCNNSNELGYYYTSKEAKHNFEPTGRREICGFYDLVNTCKFLAEDKAVGGLWYAGGCYDLNGDNTPLADLRNAHYRDYNDFVSVGWLVLTIGCIDD